MRAVAALIVIGTLALAPATTAEVTAPFQIFFKVAGIDGGSMVQGYEDWSQAVSFGHAACAVAAPGGGAPGGVNPNWDRFRVLKSVDRSTPELRLAVLAASQFAKAEIEISISGLPDPVWHVELTDVHVREITSSGSGAAGTSRELVTLDYEQIEWSYSDGVNPPVTTNSGGGPPLQYGPC